MYTRVYAHLIAIDTALNFFSKGNRIQASLSFGVITGITIGSPTESEFISADINEDGSLDILDVVGIINLIL